MRLVIEHDCSGAGPLVGTIRLRQRFNKVGDRCARRRAIKAILDATRAEDYPVLVYLADR